MTELQQQSQPNLPRIWALKDVCRRYIPQAPQTIINIARPAPDGIGYVAKLGNNYLRLCKIGTRWAVSDYALRDFLARSGVRLNNLPQEDAELPAQSAKRKPGRPRQAAMSYGPREM